MSEATGTLGVVLAGGAGSRVGGADKGLLRFAGRPLIEHVIDALRPQCEMLMIVANRNREAYGRLAPTVADAPAGFAGPLAGIATALERGAIRDRGGAILPLAWMLMVPVDCPSLPRDLHARLREALDANPAAPCAYARDRRGPQPLVALFRIDAGSRAGLVGSARAALSIHASPRRWLGEIGAVVADFSDRGAVFVNLNTPADFGAAGWRRDA
jgi:molybdenum cofactor guanylyltransferase